MATVRLIYFSEICIDNENIPMIEQLNQILDAAQKFNSTKNITGALIFDNKWFVQVLEGTLEDVWALYKKIELDPRHVNIRFVEMLTVPSRRFSHWSMGYAERTEQSAAVFAPYLYDGKFEPAYMASERIMSLMVDVSSSFDRPSASA